MKRFIKISVLASSLYVSAVSFAHAVTVDTSIFRVGNATSTSISGYIVSLYNIGLALGGILAAGMITIGAIYRITSAGSPDRVHEGNDMIIQALWAWRFSLAHGLF